MNNLAILATTLKENADAQRAEPMKRYMKNQFEFYGISAPIRKKILSDFYKNNTLVFNDFDKEIIQFYQTKYRETQYCAMEITQKYYKKNISKDSIKTIEKMILIDSWWDTVDFIADKILGLYGQKFPEEIPNFVNRFMKSENIWLQRSCILFQLKYKEKTDTKLLFDLCEKLSYSNEFFIQKAIGWALREYAKTDAKTVYNFVETHDLKPLSKREALKHQSI